MKNLISNGGKIATVKKTNVNIDIHNFIFRVFLKGGHNLDCEIISDFKEAIDFVELRRVLGMGFQMHRIEYLLWISLQKGILTLLSAPIA